MNKLPPLDPTNFTPKEIIGYENIALFKEFYAIASSSSNGGEFPSKRIAKKINEQDLLMIADILARLRGHGYYPDGFKPNGDIRWATGLNGQVQIEMEKGLPALQGKSIGELAGNLQKRVQESR